MTNSNSAKQSEIPLRKVFTNPDVVKILYHKKRQSILKALIEKECTIYDLKIQLNLNPGEISRHIKHLIKAGLVVKVKKETNDLGMTLKYYRATAHTFEIKLKWPPKSV
ncbi:MAG: ArsR/SmtB family transcription factor [Promethearchaeota archaeon]